MGFNFNFFGESQHRVFNYKPRYYDVEKEERRRFFGTDQADDKEGYTPGKYISGSFRDGNYQRMRTPEKSALRKIIGMVGLVLFFIVLYYIAKFYMVILF